MRAGIAALGAVLSLFTACSKNENAGIEEAQRAAEEEQKKKVAEGGAAKTIRPPVPGDAVIPCEQLIDTAAFTTALGEVEPLSTRDSRKTEPEAAGSCSLVRGGVRPSEAEQKARLKKEGRLGVLPGDEVCNVTAFCRTIEDADKFKARCDPKNRIPDESMGTFSCKQLVMVGADDVFVWRFFDADTKCIFQVKGGPSQVDAELTRKCALTARDTIGAAQIAVGGAPAPKADEGPKADEAPKAE